MTALIMILQLLLGLSLIVGLHEFGHMIAARLFGMRVEEFSIGFPPRLLSVKKGSTQYSLGAILLGGYVKISGMIDESLELKKIKQAPKPYEFRAKPAWQRLLVMMGGIIMNVISGIFIFTFLIYINGEEYISKEEVNKHGIVACEYAQNIGLLTGDKIIEINGKDYEKFGELFNPNLFIDEHSFYSVSRNGKIIHIPIPDHYIEAIIQKDEDPGSGFIEPFYEFKVEEIIPGEAADRAGLIAGDRIQSLNGIKTDFLHQFKTAAIACENQIVSIVILRDDVELENSIAVSTDGKIGAVLAGIIKITKKEYGLIESTLMGARRAFSAVFITAKLLSKVVAGKINFSDTFTGPIGIAKEFGGTWNWSQFFNLVGLLSMVLAFMNFLPIPALDGGHIIFLSYEMISGRTPSQKFMVAAQKAGMLLLLVLMLFVIFSDIIKELN